jgi:hypothetical protein
LRYGAETASLSDCDASQTNSLRYGKPTDRNVRPTFQTRKNEKAWSNEPHASKLVAALPFLWAYEVS